jgi:hypothetical protein
MMRVDPDREADVDEWNHHPRLATSAQLDALRAIGAPATGLLSIPCACRTRSGVELPHCVVRLQNRPPLWGGRVLFLDEVVDVEPSPHALPLDVRAAVFDADEIAMGFAPTLVRTPSGRRYLIDIDQYFFFADQTQGKDVKLADGAIDRGDLPPITRWPPEQIVDIFGDYDERCAALRASR